jgi:hypothetical protein
MPSRKNQPANDSAKMKRMLIGQNRALELRLKGLSLRQIAAELKVSHQAVKRYLDLALAQLIQDQNLKMDEIRAMELSRLDALMASLWPRAMGDGDEPPHLGAIAQTLKVMERRAKLLGLDAPTRVQAEVTWQDELKGLGVNPSEVLGALAQTLTQRMDAHDDPA